MIPSAYSAVLSSRAMAHPMFDHPFVGTMSEGGLAFREARLFAQLYLPHVLRVGLYQVTALANSPSDEVADALGGLIAAGGLGPGPARLARRFAGAMGLDLDTLDDGPDEPCLERFVSTHYRLVASDPLTSAGCAAFGLMWPIPALHEAFITGLRAFGDLSDYDLALFLPPAETVAPHQAAVMEALWPFLADDADARRRFEHGVDRCLDAHHDWLSGLEVTLHQHRRGLAATR